MQWHKFSNDCFIKVDECKIRYISMYFLIFSLLKACYKSLKLLTNSYSNFALKFTLDNDIVLGNIISIIWQYRLPNLFI